MHHLLNKPIHIIGIGGIGAVISCVLARKGYSVIMVDDHPGKVQASKKMASR